MIKGAIPWEGQTIASGRYRIVSKLGEGGMGVVYRGRDQRLESDVVIKVPHALMLYQAEFAARFAREVRSLVKLSYPHIVQIQDVGEHDGLPFAVMPYLAGGSLEDRRSTDPRGVPQPFDPVSIAHWLPDIAKVLDFVHEQGYVHRDVKPSNILFDVHG